MKTKLLLFLVILVLLSLSLVSPVSATLTTTYSWSGSSIWCAPCRSLYTYGITLTGYNSVASPAVDAVDSVKERPTSNCGAMTTGETCNINWAPSGTWAGAGGYYPTSNTGGNRPVYFVSNLGGTYSTANTCGSNSEMQYDTNCPNNCGIPGEAPGMYLISTTTGSTTGGVDYWYTAATTSMGVACTALRSVAVSGGSEGTDWEWGTAGKGNDQNTPTVRFDTVGTYTLTYTVTFNCQMDVFISAGTVSGEARPTQAAYNTWRKGPTTLTETKTVVVTPPVVVNTPPTKPGISLTPSTPAVGNTKLTCTVSTASTDQQNDQIKYTYQWYKEGVLQNGYTTNTGLLDSGVPPSPASITSAISSGQVWACSVTPTDSNNAAGQAGYAYVTAQVTCVKPIVPFVLYGPADKTENIYSIYNPSSSRITPFCRPSNYDSTKWYSYEFYKLAPPTYIPIQLYSWPCSAGTGTGPPVPLSGGPQSGELYECIIRACVSTDTTCISDQGWAYVTINSPPTVSVSVTPKPAPAGAVLSCTATTNDPDNPNFNQQITCDYKWSINGIDQLLLAKTGQSCKSPYTYTLTGTPASAGDTWKCTVTPTDSLGLPGTPVSDQVTIAALNNPPSVTVAVSPTNPSPNMPIVCSVVTSSDPDGDTIAYTYQWYKKTPTSGWSERPSYARTTSDLQYTVMPRTPIPGVSPVQLYADTVAGDQWKCVVTPTDSKDLAGTPASAIATIIQNNPPTATVTITPIPLGPMQPLTCNVAGSDQDGDAITYTYQWFKGGSEISLFGESDVSSTSYTVSPGQAIPGVPGQVYPDSKVGDVWWCVVTPTDSRGLSGNPASATATVTAAAAACGPAAKLDYSSSEASDPFPYADGQTGNLRYCLVGDLANVPSSLPPGTTASWTCTPISGTPLTCMATRAPQVALCGPAAKLDYSSSEASDPFPYTGGQTGNLVYCTIGVPNPLTPSDPTASTPSIWTCTPTGGTPLTCTATRAPNQPPTVSASITPTSPQAGATTSMTCNALGGSDPDGNYPLTYSYVWSINFLGGWIAMTSPSAYAAVTSNTVSMPTTVGQQWKCRVTPQDGLLLEGNYAEAAVTISSAPLPATDGVCGLAWNGGTPYTASQPFTANVADLCSLGTAYTDSGLTIQVTALNIGNLNPTPGGPSNTWYCSGSNSGHSATCQVTRSLPVVTNTYLGQFNGGHDQVESKTFQVTFMDRSTTSPVAWTFSLFSADIGCNVHTFTPPGNPISIQNDGSFYPVGTLDMSTKSHTNTCVVTLQATAVLDPTVTISGTYSLIPTPPLCPTCSITEIPAVIHPIGIYSTNRADADAKYSSAAAAVDSLSSKCALTCSPAANSKLSEAQSNLHGAELYLSSCYSTPEICRLSQYYSVMAKELAEEGLLA